jgi:hypothetical protein
MIGATSEEHSRRIWATFSHVLEETKHFSRWAQTKVAKIVQCGEAFILNRIEEEATREGGLKFCDVGFCLV